MTEEDPDLLAGDNLDGLRGRNPYSPMSERFRLTELLENARYQNNLLAQKCRELEKERDEARREICNIVAGKQGKKDNHSPDAIEHAKLREWDCFNTPVSEVRHVLNGVVSEVRKAAPPAFEVEE